MSKTASPFPEVRRVITGHTADAQPVLLRDEVTERVFVSPDHLNSVFNIYRTDQVPANNDGVQGEWKDVIADKPFGKDTLVSAEGAVVRVFDYAPGATSPMHRTESLDFGIIHSGTITLTLDDGVTKTLNKGDVIVQRGTIHSWKNESDEWTRMYWVVVGAKAVEVNGQVLGEQWPKP
ncbi:hypothetical protein EUX98_g6375 [Antrodiella citrinella]|uniref:Cupin type-2 domain-containing protein n=2 Tax=Antrodiella citrinella TaxID=2447956 RepID=A0A4S4MPZ7_9APHY|nr:hypothetical protein EUX98_g6375 [Antrodiella citrinella]